MTKYLYPYIFLQHINVLKTWKSVYSCDIINSRSLSEATLIPQQLLPPEAFRNINWLVSSIFLSPSIYLFIYSFLFLSSLTGQVECRRHALKPPASWSTLMLVYITLYSLPFWWIRIKREKEKKKLL